MIYYPLIKENDKCFIENNINNQFVNLFPIEYCIINYTSESFSNSPLDNINSQIVNLFPKDIKNYTSESFSNSPVNELFSISPITNNIYLSGIFGANNLNKLKEYNITYIINCTKNKSENFQNITYMNIPIDDTSNQNIEQYFDSSYNFIEYAVNNNHNILVHCFAGKSRSASILIAYFMKKNKWSYDLAYEYLKEKRQIINPNIFFINALKEYMIQVNKN